MLWGILFSVTKTIISIEQQSKFFLYRDSKCSFTLDMCVALVATLFPISSKAALLPVT